MMVSVLMFGYVLFSSFGAALTSHLAVKTTMLPVNNFKEALDSPLGFAMEKGTARIDMFRNAEEGSTLNRLFNDKMIIDPRYGIIKCYFVRESCHVGHIGIHLNNTHVPHGECCHMHSNWTYRI
jgi:hypothetical protein